MHIPLPLNSIRFIWNYEREAQDLITTLKYGPSIGLCRYAARILRDSLGSEIAPYDNDLIVPMPASTNALRTRGFNQCAILARELARHFGVPHPLNRLIHKGYRAPQASLPHHLRLINVRRSFKVAHSVKDKRILLVDDVITTGATATSAACTLLNAGARSVSLVALARSQSWEEYRYAIYQRVTRRMLKS